jgi:CrcB protein
MTFFSAMLRHPYMIVGIGGAIGSIARAGITDLVNRWIGNDFPFGTVAVNVTGAIVMGLLAGYGETEPAKLIFSPGARAFLMIGVLGGYTTFSSFSLQTFLLIEQGNLAGAILNILLSVLLCVAGIWLGFTVIRAFE